MAFCNYFFTIILFSCFFNTPNSVSSDLSGVRPNANTYWVMPNKLLAGEYPLDLKNTRGTKKIKSYLDAGITFFLDLTQSHEVKAYDTYISTLGEGYVYKRMPIKDMKAPSKAYMAEILDTIDQAVGDGHVVYVHCRAGIGRTGTVVGAYLVRHGMTGEQALQHIAQLWKTVAKSSSNKYSPKALQQREFIRKYR
ncbi:dual specificity protein phosphatase family protein [Candidatus Dependentiae bacterium]|nr:dual specificity protein phosphatase family protein [Candidatus Dependentiae bacterium]